MRWLVAAALLRHGAPSPPCWVRITHPADGADVALDGGGLPLGFRVGGAVDGLDVCVQLTNKRVSYESFTHCGAASAREFVLSGFLPGVWRAKAYLAASPGPAGLRRGAAPDGDCGGHESWFLADREAWERDVGLSAAPGGNGTRARRVRDRLLAAARGSLGAELRAAARGRGALVVSMANGPHVGLALNMVRRTLFFPSLAPRRFSSLEPVVARRTRRGGAGAPRSSSSRSPGPRRATSPRTASRPMRSPSRTRRRSRRGATSRAGASGASRY